MCAPSMTIAFIRIMKVFRVVFQGHFPPNYIRVFFIQVFYPTGSVSVLGSFRKFLAAIIASIILLSSHQQISPLRITTEK